MIRRLAIILLLSASAFGQAWSGILSSSRAIDWSNIGLPATFPDGETTPNPWTPPTRSTQCVTASCNTLAGGTVTAASINAALSSASQANYVLVPAGTFTITGTIDMSTKNNVTLRGSGSQATIVKLTSGQVVFGSSSSSGGGHPTSAAGNYTQGGTSIVLNTVTGSTPATGMIVHEYQCDTGKSGYGTCSTGTNTDNGGIWVCAEIPVCDIDGGSGFQRHQQQTRFITNVVNNGGGTFTLTVDNLLYLPNWDSARTPELEWIAPPTGVGFENMTIWEPSSEIGRAHV
jgi:hypothetical protein